MAQAVSCRQTRDDRDMAPAVSCRQTRDSRCMAQAVSCRLLTAEARMKFRLLHMRLVVDREALRLVLTFSIVSIIPEIPPLTDCVYSLND